MFYGYVTYQESDTQRFTDIITAYTTQHHITNLQMIKDMQHVRVHWEKRTLFNLIVNTANPGDTIIATQASQIAGSTLQLLEILQAMAHHHIRLILTEHKLEHTPTVDTMTKNLIQLLECAEAEFVAQRAQDALKSCHAAGIALGRPKGRKNKSRKLDRYRHDIINYLRLNISKASIAKLVGCHPQTLYNYLQEEGLEAIVKNSPTNVSSQTARQLDTTK